MTMLFSNTRKLERAMANAASYEEWQGAAIGWDKKCGADRWRSRDPTRSYDYVSIRIRLDSLRKFRARQDNPGLLFALNEGLHGNMAGMGNPSLYYVSKFGTKQLVVEYVEEIVSALEYIASAKVDDIRPGEKLDFFRRAAHCFGRSALMMSGSGSLLFFHTGVLKALSEQGVLPNILSGSSGGALMGAMVSSHANSQLKNIFEPELLAEAFRADEDTSSRPILMRPRLPTAVQLREAVERMIPDLTFQEAFQKTGRSMNISIAAAETQQTSRLLNATTSPNVYLREAVMASTAAPGVFPPVMLEAKNARGERQPYLPSRKWTDGSMSDDLPAKRLSRLYGVNHYIVSQTNPHVIPFISDGAGRKNLLSVIRLASTRTAREWANASSWVLQSRLRHDSQLGKGVNTVMSILNQDYLGDINILPSNRLHNPLKMLNFRSARDIAHLLEMGERCTWPKLERVKIQTRVSRVLDDLLLQYEKKALKAFES